MGFDYDKFKEEAEGEGHWATYSDLFMVLSLVFLLLYVVAGLRNGTHGLQSNIEYKQLKSENEALKQQIKVFNTINEDYLKKQASENEQQVYRELMDKLDLLQEETRKEKEDLIRQANENSKKVRALNKYQQVIRNIIDANLLAKTRIKRQDKLIVKKNETIKVRESEIENLQNDLESKRKTIEQKKAQIAKVESNLEKQVKRLNRMYKKQKRNRKKIKKQIARIQAESQEKLEKLKNEQKEVQFELASVNRKLYSASQELEQVQSQIEESSKVNQNLLSKLEKSKQVYETQINQLQSEHNEKERQAREAFETKLASQKLNAKQREQQWKDYQKQVEQREDALQNKLGDLNSKLKVSKKELGKAKEKLEARKKLAQKIKEAFKQAGVDASIDGQTGDVTLEFDKEYFNTGSHRLKNGMKDILEKTMPAYTRSLFDDNEIAKKIDSVEIVGFASPTYNGKLIDPKSLSPGDRKAIDYNMDLSYYRARSIFKYIFDTKKMKYPYQKKLLPKIKVTGRSFLAEDVKGRNIASSIDQKEYCKKYDCKKAQKVLIRFNLDD